MKNLLLAVDRASTWLGQAFAWLIVLLTCLMEKTKSFFVADTRKRIRAGSVGFPVTAFEHELNRKVRADPGQMLGNAHDKVA